MQLNAPAVVMLGAGGHAKVLLSLLQAIGVDVLGICDPVLAAQSVTIWRGIAACWSWPGLSFSLTR